MGDPPARRAGDPLKVLGNAHRLVIRCELMMGGERSVGELVRRDGLVRTRRSAQTVYYFPADHRARAVFEMLARLDGRNAEGADGPTPAPVVGVPDASVRPDVRARAARKP